MGTQGRTEPGWYPRSDAPGMQDYWDGSRWSGQLTPVPPPVSAKSRLGAMLIGIGVAAVGAILVANARGNENLGGTIGEWLIILGGLVAIVNLLLAGWRLMRDG